MFSWTVQFGLSVRWACLSQADGSTCVQCVQTQSHTFLPSQLFLSGASSYPGSHAHLKLPKVLTHLCSQPPLSGFRHSSSSVLMTQTHQLNGQGPKHQLLIELFFTCVCTFEEVCSKACFIYSAIRDKFHPEGVGGGTDIFRLIIAAESTNQRAVLRQTVSNL